MLTVRTQVKDILKESGFGVENLSSDFMERLDEKVKQIILDAVKRAKDNRRRTVMGKDIWIEVGTYSYENLGKKSG